MNTSSYGEHPWLWPVQAPAPLKAASIHGDAARTLLYRNRRITVRPSGVQDYAFRAFVDGWPVSNRRRGAPGGFPALDQAIGRCKVVIDGEAPARRWLVARRLLRDMRSALARAVFGDRRGLSVSFRWPSRALSSRLTLATNPATCPVSDAPLRHRASRQGPG